MKVKKLKLKNFRNYSEQEIEFFDGINIFYGENAQGKTNILEALYMFSSSKSHRGANDKELIRYDNDYSETEIEFFSQERDQSASFEIYSNKNKRLFLNGIEQRRLKALFGIFNTVIFSPEDLFLIKEGPEERRKFMDTDISQIKPEYFNLIKEYKKLIVLKNKLLRSDNFNMELFDVYNEKIVKYGAKISIHRMRFIERIKELSNLALLYISDNREKLSLYYESGICDNLPENKAQIEEKYREILNDIKEEEITKKMCLCGPHRDDIVFYINGKDAKKYGSQGQQRSIILSLKLAEFKFMKEVMGEEPVLLLDDILSELDIKRQNKLLKFIRNNQTIITCTDRDLYEKIKYPYLSFKVKDGRVD